MTGRNSTIIEQSYVILRGLISKGIIIYGPFMYKETITHGDT